ncbi:IS1380-Spn1 transposase [Streptococcus pneumoniae]|nr:IS1380-Spn1 transposase [Streptococcus pneumoniae]
MNSLPNHHFQNKSFYQLSFDGGHLTQYGGLIFFQELFSQLKLKERISKYLVTNDQRRYCRYSDSDILVQFLFQLLTGYGTDYACKELSADAYFPKLLEGGQLASQPTLSRFLSRTDEETVHSLRCLNLELVEFFLQFHQLNQLIVDIDSTHFTTYGKQEGVAYNAHYRAHGYHPLYAFEGKTGYCFNAQLRPGNRYCSEEADSFITPVLERFNQLLFRMDSGFATPKLYDLIEKTGQYYLIKLKKNTVLSRLGDLSLPCPQDEDLTILPHSAYSETLYQAGSWSHKRRVCQFSERKEGNLFYDVISLVTNMTSGTSQDQFQLYRGRGQAENFIKEMKEGFFGDKTDSSTLIKNEVRMMMSCIAYNLYLFLNLKTIQNPCLSLDPGWFLFSPNGCFLLDKKEFPLYGISVEKNTKRKETHMNSLPNHHFQNKSFYQLSFDGGHLNQYGGLIFFQELFSQLKLKERISKYLVTNDQRRYCRYLDSDILVQFLFQLLTGYGTDYACKELSADAYFPKLLEGGQLASQPTLSRFLSRTDEETVHSLRCLNLELVEFFLQFHQLNQLIVDIDSTHFTTYGKQEGVAYNAHYRAHGYHPLYAFEGKTGYCFNAQLRPGNRYCSEEADSFITPVLERFNQLLFRMDSGFATPKLYDLIEKTGQYYLIKLKKNTVLSRLGDLSLPCPQDEDLTILPHSAYSETLYQAGSWSHKRRVCQFSERKEGNLFYDVISLVTNMTSGTSQDQFQLYRGRGQAENFIKEMKEGFFGDKTDSSTLIKNEVRMMMSCIAYNLYLFLKHLAGGDFQTLTIKRFRHLFLHVVGKCVRTGRKQLLKLSSLYAYSELFSALYSRIRKVNLNLPVPYEPPGRKASLMMH